MYEESTESRPGKDLFSDYAYEAEARAGTKTKHVRIDNKPVIHHRR